MKEYENFKEAKDALLKNNVIKIRFYKLRDELYVAFFEGIKVIMGLYFAPENEIPRLVYYDTNKDAIKIAELTVKSTQEIKGKRKCKEYIDSLETEE